MYLFLIRLFFISQFSMAAVEGEPWCVDRGISLRKDQLQCLKSTSQTRVLRKFLHDIDDGRAHYIALNTNRAISAKKMLALFDRPILVFQVSIADHGGYAIRFVFKNFPHEFTAWLAYHDDKIFDPEILVDSGLEMESAKIRKRLQQKEFIGYWL